jgi:hypothetical protein
VVEREGELSEITNRLLEARPDSVRGRVDAIRNFALSCPADLRGLLTADVADIIALKAKLSKGVCRGRGLHHACSRVQLLPGSLEWMWLPSSLEVSTPASSLHWQRFGCPECSRPVKEPAHP